MKILIVLTYFRPHISGLTIYAERLAFGFLNLGHEVTILTSQYDSSLPLEETNNGIKIIRVPILFRLSKGVIMPLFGVRALKLIKDCDAVQIHLPQFESSFVAILGRIFKKPTIITYHCDLQLPSGVLNYFANAAVNLMNHSAAIFTKKIVTYTQDYAENSKFLRRYLDKVKAILPPVELPKVSDRDIENFNNRNNFEKRKPVIGMAARFATEKGVEILLDAIPKLMDTYPNLQVQFAGPYKNIIGEEKYFKRLIPAIEKLENTGNWKFVGTLNPEEMAAFYPNLDVLVLPSLNSTEAFGLVQIEAMINKVPVVASNLPGVREPVNMHGMGEVVAIGDPKALTEAVIKILNTPNMYRTDSKEISKKYNKESVASAYEKLFIALQ